MPPDDLPGDVAAPAALVGAALIKDEVRRLPDAPGVYRSYDPQVATAYLRANRAPASQESLRNVLALSGGGMYGAYTAGVLKGMTASGKRPTFDVVTGISTGSLIAPFAFLGPEYDDFLEERYTSVRSGDIYRMRGLLAIPWSDSIYDSRPLRQMIAREIDEPLLAKIAAQHARGRRLYVGTTSLDSQRLVVWDMGAIAASGRPLAATVVRRLEGTRTCDKFHSPSVRFRSPKGGGFRRRPARSMAYPPCIPGPRSPAAW